MGLALVLATLARDARARALLGQAYRYVLATAPAALERDRYGPMARFAASLTNAAQ